MHAAAPAGLKGCQSGTAESEGEASARWRLGDGRRAWSRGAARSNLAWQWGRKTGRRCRGGPGGEPASRREIRLRGPREGVNRFD